MEATSTAKPRDPADDPPVSVGFVSSYGGLGGSEIYLERLLTAFERPWVRCVISLGEGPLMERLAALGVEATVIPTSGRPHSMALGSLRLRRLLHRIRPDVVHANGLKAAIVAAIATRGTRLPVVWVRHDFAMEGWRARALGRMCARVICVSTALSRTFQGPLMGKVQVIRTGIPRTRLDRDAARAKVVELAGPAHAGPIISLVGQLIPGKGHAELLEVLPELLRRLPSTRILFIGGSAGKRFDGYVAGLRTRIEELGVGGVVHLVGHRDDALTLIAGSDIIVMPSLSSQEGAETEGFPLIALEALSVGTPLVAYEVGGVLELAGDCALLVKAGDRGQLLEAIHRVAADGATRKSLSTCGPRRVSERFTMDRMIEALQSAYRLARRA